MDHINTMKKERDLKRKKKKLIGNAAGSEFRSAVQNYLAWFSSFSGVGKITGAEEKWMLVW